MTRADSDLETIRLAMTFSTWLHERSKINLKSGMGEFMFKRWLKGDCIVLRNTPQQLSVTFK